MAHTDRQPTQEVFDDIKQAATKVWSTYDDTYGYATEKLNRVDSIVNYADNWYTFIGMFDSRNQAKMMLELKRDDTVVFLLDQHVHYGYSRPQFF